MKGACRQGGFTLLEMLVALTILALVLGTAATALGTLGRGSLRLTERAERLEQLALLRDILRRDTARALPGASAGGAGRLAFDGREDALAFTVMEPPGPGRGGPATVGFTVTPGQVRYRHARGDGQARTVLLADDPGLAFRFAYLSTLPDGSQAWVERWTEAGMVPDMVRLEITAGGVPQPAIVVRLRNDADPGCVLALGEGFCRHTVQAEALP